MLAMPCNTAHHWHAELADSVGIPFPHIADAVAAELPQGSVRVGIVATEATLAARIYTQRLDPAIDWMQPPTDVFEACVQPGIDAVKRNASVDAGRLLEPVISGLLDRGAVCVVLACTELPVALDAIASPLRERCIDSTAALARTCVRLWQARASTAAVPNL